MVYLNGSTSTHLHEFIGLKEKKVNSILKGAAVKNSIDEYIGSEVERLKSSGLKPQIATLRIGNDPGEVYYESSIKKRAEKFGIESRTVVFPADVTQEEAERTLKDLNNDDSVHGIIMLMPFPHHIDADKMCEILNPEKDIDAITNTSYGNLFANRTKDAFCACTAEACMEILKYYGIDVKGKRVTIIGRSLRVGKPLMMMMMNSNATVTVCHTRTRHEDMLKSISESEIIVLATGQTESFTPDMFRDGQIIIDVGTGTGKDGKMAGDLDQSMLESSNTDRNLAYTPVPGGVGTVTTAILLRNLIKAAGRSIER